MKQLTRLAPTRVHQLYAMRAAGGFPPKMTKEDKDFMIRYGVCDDHGTLHGMVLAHLAMLETAQVPVINQIQAKRGNYEFLFPTHDGTACYVRFRHPWEGTRILFWIMLDFPLCLWGIP